MSFLHYWRHKSPEDQTDFATAVGVKKTHLSKIAGGQNNASDDLVRRMIEHDPEVRQVWFL